MSLGIKPSASIQDLTDEAKKRASAFESSKDKDAAFTPIVRGICWRSLEHSLLFEGGSKEGLDSNQL